MSTNNIQLCPQCKKEPNGASSRLVRDSCGHQKCRVCLLLDEEHCQQCNSDNNKTIKTNECIIKHDNNNLHTSVITCSSTIKNETINNKFNKDEIKITKESNNKKSTKQNKLTKRSYKALIIPSHISVLKDPIQYKCNICNKQFITKRQIKYHIYCTGISKPYKCDICLKEFVTETYLSIHQLKHSDKKPFICQICNKSFNENVKLTRHSLLHSTIKPFVCSECGKAFKRKESLKIHILIHRGEKPFKCKVCNAEFNNSSNLNKHLISHSKEKVHMCDQCGKRFKFKWTLTVHRRSHLRIRPYECKICSKAFVNSKDLHRHELIHNENKPFSCSICLANFRRKDNLYRHMKNSHPGKKGVPVINTMKKLIPKSPTPVIDNPNAINVITASPACLTNNTEKCSDKPECRTDSVINGPLKLAFKTTAFKSNYNIKRTYDCEPLVSNKLYDMAESVNICQKILSPHSPPPLSRKINVSPTNLSSSTIIQTSVETSTSTTSTDICQKILSTSHPLHYETSFEHKKHAIIKNIKFKLPPNYTNLKENDDLVPLKAVKNINMETDNENNSINTKTYTELKNVTTSVIVNTNSNYANMHWRRRTSQNLNSKIVDK